MDSVNAFWMQSLELDCPEIWINNAGVSYSALTSRISEPDLNELIDVNARHTSVLAQRMAERMAAEKGGHILNIVSHQALGGGVGLSAYALSKGFVYGFTKDLAVSYGSQKVRVNAICPGFMPTDMTQGLSEEVRELYRLQNALQELSPLEEICRAIYDISQWKHVSGQMFVLDSRVSVCHPAT